MRTLLVHYLPRAGRSRTRRLLDAFPGGVGAGQVETVDLTAEPPRAFDSRSLPAYVRRNYGGEPLVASGAQAETAPSSDGGRVGRFG
jgi:hypothetical protein